jgi:hypothetical protein
METQVSGINGVRMAATLIGLICMSAAGAQQLDTRSLAEPSVQAASCSEVDWAQDMLTLYPRIAEGCQQVVISEGKKWARFDAEFLRSDNRAGTVTLDFKNRQGRSIGVVTLKPAAEQRVLIGGQRYEFSDLTRGQRLNLYVPERMFAVAVEPGAPVEQLAQIVSAPVQLAQADPAPATAAQRLPNTAGPLPLFALAGLVSLLAGLSLTIRRRFLGA